MVLVRLLFIVFVAWIGSVHFVFAADADGPVAGTRITRLPISLRPGIGRVRFPITCRLPDTQLYFEQGVALLHGDDRSGADRSFYQSLRLEPDCAMAWWGLAIAHEDDLTLAAYYADQAAQRQSSVTAREKMWINALKVSLNAGTSEIDRQSFLVTAYDRIATQYPDDTEALAFLARQWIQNRDAGMPLPVTTSVDLAIDHVLRQNPDSPAIYSKMRLWEDQYPERAEAAARHVQQALPAAPRILNAAARIFGRLGQPEPALACLKQSQDTVRNRLVEDRQTVIEVPGVVENLALQMDQLVSLGRLNEAIAIGRQLIEAPYPESPSPVPTGSTKAGLTAHGMSLKLTARSNAPAHPTRTGQKKLLEILVSHGRWNELLELADCHYFDSFDLEIQCRTCRAIGLAQLSHRDFMAIEEQRQQLQAMLDSQGSGAKGPLTGALRAEITTALQELNWCAAAAASPADPIPQSPVPSQQLKDLFPSLCAFSVDAVSPLDTVGQARGSVAAHLSQIRRHQTREATEIVHQDIASLRSAYPQLDSDLLARSGFERSPSSPASPDRPSPQPIPAQVVRNAPALILPDRHGNSVNIEALRGQPVVVVFYLGAGCPHCIEQLRSFAPLKEEYARAGVAIVAVSTDSVTGLQETFEVAGAEDAIPFQLVSDESLGAFRDFGAFDTRDNVPLHGTFLINATGQIVWQNIRREPFMETRALLDEAIRVGAIRSGSVASPEVRAARLLD